MPYNHTTASASPGLSAIEQIVADLFTKYQKEESRSSELQKLLDESNSRKNSLNTAISLLRHEYHLKPDKSNSNTGQEEDEVPQEDKKQWERPNNASWLELVKEAIKVSDALLTNSEIMDFHGMDEEAKNKHKQTLSGAMANYRDSGHLIGIPVYFKSQKGASFSQFYTGIPIFFDDIAAKQLKPEYELKLRDKLRERNLFLTQEEAVR